jgi:quinohemoprotein ethanol dehydrogenase
MQRFRGTKVSWAIGAAVLLLASLGAVKAFAGDPVPANVTQKRLLNADKDAGNWMAPGRTFGEQRYSPLDKINTTNVKQLGLAWYIDLPTTRGVEATPLVIDGVLYNITPWNITTAYEATTGKVLWTFDPEVPRKFGELACCDIVTRGLAAWNGKIYLATLDGRLIALDARNGKPVWSVQTFEPIWPYTITGAPRVYDGEVIIGNAGAEGAARGYVSAYNAETGARTWRFYTVPGDPAKGYATEAEKKAAATWKGEWWKTGGGGTAWDSFAYDPELKLVYIGTGNGGPWVQKYRSPGGGDNLYLSSIVAVDVHTGKYAWHYQETPGDEWDYTATQSIILADLPINGKMRKLLLHAPKNGFFYELDRKTGELVSAKNYVPTTWATGIDMKTGRPIENPKARYGDEPVLVSPNAGGGHNWYPMAYSPKTKLAYFPAFDSSMAYASDPNFKQKPGAMSQLGLNLTGFEEQRKQMAAEIAKNSKGFLLAWDPVAQKEAWRVPYPTRGNGGVLVTAGDLVFHGNIKQTFAAYDARTGALLWEQPTQQVPIAAPMTFTVGGEQYVAVNAGWGGGIAHGPAAKEFQNLKLSPTARLLVYKIGGKASLPPLAATEAASNAPPRDAASPDQVRLGSRLFAETCAVCHGEQARGGVKDLRVMSAATRAEFYDIVLKGSRQEKGMVSFAGKLSRADAEAINAYLVRRANEDYGK